MYYLVASDEEETEFRVLKIDRRVLQPKHLKSILREDPITYTRDDLEDMLEMIHDGNHRHDVCLPYELIQSCLTS
jgi:hypothetical protein